MQQQLSGNWYSKYFYGDDKSHEHIISFDHQGGVVRGESLAQPDGSRVTFNLEFDPENNVLSGLWREETSPDGPYAGKVFHGALQFILNTAGTVAAGTWVGFNSRGDTVHNGPWVLHRTENTTP